MNAIAVHGDAVGPTLFYGAGAGELPTASAVVGGPDRDRARDPARQRGPRGAAVVPARVAARRCRSCRSASSRAAPTCASPRADRPGVLGHIASALGEHGIGIESVIQKGAAPRAAPCRCSCSRIPAREAAVRRALERDRRAARVDRADPARPDRGGALMAEQARATAPGSRASATPTERYPLDEVVYTDSRRRRCSRSSTTWTSCAKTPAAEWKELLRGPRAHDAVAVRLGRLGQEGVGAARASTTRTSSRCTRATRTCSGRSATGAQLGARGSLDQAVRQHATPARSRTSA